jgi:3',5'-cyclic AMP phosphodiesterase CpdA
MPPADSQTRPEHPARATPTPGPAPAQVEIEPLPAREPWEEPPAAGWASHLGELALETLALAGAVAAALGAWRLTGLARRLAADPAATAPPRALLILLWVLACALAVSLVVFVWRRIGGLAFIAAMLTDHGRVARFGGRPPIWLDQPPAGGLRLAHLSDLHVTESDRVRMVERPIPGGNRPLARLLLGARELVQSDLVIVTGDVTDRGSAASWRRFLDLVGQAHLNDKVVLVPGNHDLAFIDPWHGIFAGGALWRRNDRFGIVQLANLVKFCEAFAATGGGRRGSVLRDGEPVRFVDAWLEVEQSVRPLLAVLPSLEVPRLRLGRGFGASRRERRIYVDRIDAARNRLLALFPVAVPLPDQDAVLFVLNSCTPVCRHPSTNGLGWVGRQQYRRLDRLAGFFPQPLKLVALHHHVVRRVEERAHGLMARIVAKFTVLGDARPLVRFCRKHGVRAVLNGHRHLSYQLRLPNGTVLMAAPSSTLGDELAHDPRPQFVRYDVDKTVDQPTVGIYHRVVRLSGAAAE